MARADGRVRVVRLVSSMLFVVGATAYAVACQSSADPQVDPGPNGLLPPSGFGQESNGGGPETPYAKLAIEPANAVVTVDVGQGSPAIKFVATGVKHDGTEEKVTGGAWNFTRIDAAAFEDSKLVPTGFLGAKGQVSFRVGTQVVKTNATVKLRIRAGKPPAASVIAAFDSALDEDAAMKIVYPYDGTVWPRGLVPANLQWNGVTASGLYRIQVEGESFVYEEYKQIEPPGRYSFPTSPVDVWSKLTDSSAGDVKVTLQRYDGTKAYKAKTQTWTIAPGNLKGTIYYTRLASSDSIVRRIEPGKPSSKFLDEADSGGCITCHSVSRDGSRIAANNADHRWAVYDAKTGALLYRSSVTSGFPGISPTGDYVAWTEDGSHGLGGFGEGGGGTLALSKYDSDTPLAKLTIEKPANWPAGETWTQPLPVHPAWAGDGKKIAFAATTSGSAIGVSQSSLWVVDVALGSNASLTNPFKLVDATPEYGATTYPSFTPDNQWVAFMRATNSFTGSATGELWMTSVDGQTKVRLDRANGAGDLASPNQSFGPSVHPIAAGGYFWVAFFSGRPYGNTHDAHNRQMWIAAVDGKPSPGKDPSHPAFYVTGQDTDSTNERPSFAVNPCGGRAQSCENGYDCCSGFCRKDNSGKLVCQEKLNECARDNEKCSTVGDCCEGLTCVGGYCAPPLAGPK